MAAGRLFLPGWMPALDNNGAPIPNARAYFYENKTDTLASVFSNEALTIPLPNPLLANSSGRFPAIWASDAMTYSYSIDAPYGPAGIPFTGDDLSVSQGVAILVAEAAEAAADEAAASAAAAAVSEGNAEQAYQDILDFAATAPEAPSIVNKLNRDGANAAASILTNIPYTQTGTGAVARSQKSKNDDVLNARDFGVVADGAADDSAAMIAAVAESIASGRALDLPAGVIVMTTGISAVLNNYLPAPSAAFAPSLTIRGQGIGRTIIDWRGAGSWWLDLSTADLFKFGIGGSLSGFTLRQTVSVANSSGIRLRSTINFTAKDIHIIGLSGDGFDDACLLGDPDGNVLLMKENIRVENCGGWGWNGAAAVGHNENSGLNSRAMFIQNCGTAEQSVITGISKANPAVVTSTAHGRANGDLVYIAGVQGMTQANSAVSGMAYVVAGVTANTFQLTGLNSTAFGAYTSGGHVVSARPKSGGVKWKGQISRHDQMFLTTNKNVSFYIENGPASAQGCDLSGVVIENPQMIGGLIAGVSGFRSSMGQTYINALQAGDQAYFGWMLDGTTDAVQQVRFSGHTVRTTSADPDFTQWASVGSLCVHQTIRVENTTWSAFGYSRQRRFTPQFMFDTNYADNVVCVAADATTARVQPSSFEAKGASVPIRLQYATGGSVPTGEWVNRNIAVVPITKPGSDGTYNIYLYDNANVVDSEASLTDPVYDSASGYMVKTGDATRTFVGRLVVSGGSWVLANSGWMNPESFESGQPGVNGWRFYAASERKIRLKLGSNRPSAFSDGTVDFWSSEEAFKTGEIVTVPAGPGGVYSTTMTVAGINPGDYIDDMQTNFGLGTFGVIATCNTPGSISVKFFDPSQTGGSLNGGAAVRLQCKYTRR